MYVIQTRSGGELSVARTLEKRGYKVKVPTKIMSVRRCGEWRESEYLVFAGYIFLDYIGKIIPFDYYNVKNSEGVINFIGGGTPLPVTEAEKQYIDWLWNGGKPIEPSKVYKTIGGAIMVMSGTLKNYPGKYIDFDIRQRRAKLKVAICGAERKITLPIRFL